MWGAGGRGGGGGGIWNSLISKHLACYSLALIFCLFFKNIPLFFKMSNFNNI